MSEILRPHAEQQYAHELAALQKADKGQKPPGWQLSPLSVVTYILGGETVDGLEIEPKYYGQRRLIEIAVATLVTDRALLLTGLPGTAKTRVSEHLAAAICGDSTLLVQGTAGSDDDSLRYGWNYARLIAEGPSEKAMVASPVMAAMQRGKIVRVEEISRMSPEVQDGLITILSEKTLPVPELNTEVQAQRGFNLIATANDRDRGVNDMSAALRRRFNTVIMPLPATLDEEVHIVRTRVAQLGEALALPNADPPMEEIKKLVTIFRELRNGRTEDGRTQLKKPSSTLSTAEAVSAIHNSLALSAYFGKGKLEAKDVASSLSGAIVRDRAHDQTAWQEYIETVMKHRKGYKKLYEACKKGSS